MRHDRLLTKVARRIQDPVILRLVKLMIKVSGPRGVPQGGVISPLLANIYLTEVDEMLEQLKETTRQDSYTYLEYARFADDLVVLVDGYPRHARLAQVAERRLREALAQLDLQVNEEKSRIVDLSQGGSFGFLGFDFRRVRSRRGVWRPQYTPKMKRRTALLRKLKEVFRRWQAQPVGRMIAVINPIVRGWVNYFRIGHASRCLTYVKDWVERKVRRHMMRVRHRRGFGWKRWSKGWLYTVLGLFDDYRVRYGGSA